MTRHEKLLAILARTPSPKDFRWQDLVTLMERQAFTVTCSGGSHHTFQHSGGFTFTMSKTHPSGVLKSYQIKDALEALKKVGASTL